MHKRHGFTVIELVVAIVVLTTLVTIGVVSFRTIQADARDRERATDVQSMATFLEAIYPLEIKDAGGNVIKSAGTYPALPKETSSTTNELVQIFSELDRTSITPPGVIAQTTPSIVPSGTYPPGPDGDPAVGGCTPSVRCYKRPSDVDGSTGEYIYAPGPKEDSLCTKPDYSQYPSPSNDTYGCRRFVIIYRKEVGNQRVVVESKRR